MKVQQAGDNDEHSDDENDKKTRKKRRGEHCRAELQQSATLETSALMNYIQMQHVVPFQVHFS
jgi:hypothetical protein